MEILPDGALVTVRFAGQDGASFQDVVRIQGGSNDPCVVHGFAQLASLKKAQIQAQNLEKDQKLEAAIQLLVQETHRIDEARLINFDVEARYGQAMEDLLRIVLDQVEVLRTRDYDFDRALELLAETGTRLEQQRLRWKALGEELEEVNRRLEQLEARQREMKELQQFHLGGRWTWKDSDGEVAPEQRYLAALESNFEPELGTSLGVLYARCVEQKVELFVLVNGDERLLTEAIYGGRSETVVAHYSTGEDTESSERIGASDWGTAPSPGTDGSSAFLAPGWVEKLRDIEDKTTIFTFYRAEDRAPIHLRFDTTGNADAIRKVEQHCYPKR